MAKTKALISFAVTAKLICVFVFAYAKSRFSRDAAQILLYLSPDTYLEILLEVNLNFQVWLTIILANGIFPR